MQFMIVFGPKKVDHKLHRKSSDWSEIIGNFSKAIYYRSPKPFVFGIIDTRDSLVKVTVNNKNVNIDFQKMSHRKMKKSDHKLHFDHKLNRFFDHKLVTPCRWIYTGCPVKKNLFRFFSTQTTINFLMYIFVAFPFQIKIFRSFEVLFKKNSIHFCGRGPQYWNTSVRAWRAKMTFLADRYLRNWLV